MRSGGHNAWKVASVGNDVPRQGQGHVLMISRVFETENVSNKLKPKVPCVSLESVSVVFST